MVKIINTPGKLKGSVVLMIIGQFIKVYHFGNKYRIFSEVHGSAYSKYFSDNNISE